MKSLTIAEQSRRPRGLLGHVVGRIMARETQQCNARGLEYVDPQQADAILEVGYGHGHTVRRLAELVPQGCVDGIDFSSTMHAIATRHNRRQIRTGRVRLQLGDCAVLPYADATFDKVLTVHTIYFWAQPLQPLREMARVLKPGGRLVLGFRPNDGGALEEQLPAAVYILYTAQQVEELLRSAGFASVRIERWRPSPRAAEYAFAVAEK